MIDPRRVTTIVAVLAIVVVVLVLRDASGDDSSGPPASSPSSAPSASPTPSEVPTDQFCAAFEAMAAAHNNHLANGTAESLAEVTAAGEAVLEMAPGTVMPPAAREGLEYFVDGVIGRESEPPPEESTAAFSQFLEVACRPGT